MYWILLPLFDWTSLTKWLNSNWFKVPCKQWFLRPWSRNQCSQGRFKADLVSDYCLTKSNQKEAISGTISHWYVWILLRILTIQKLWDFNFLRELAPGLLDGFSIGRYEKKRESFDPFAARFKAERCDFRGKNRAGAGALSKQGFLPSPSYIRNSKWRTQNASKTLIKPLLRQKDDNISQLRWFNVCSTLIYTHTWRYITRYVYNFDSFI